MLRKPIRLLWVAPALMAMDGPGCVMSEQALTRPGADPVDATLVGDWAYQGDPEQELAVRIRLRDQETMEIWWRQDDSEYLILHGYTASVRGRTYANLQFTGADCFACGEEQRAAVRDDFAKDFATIDPTNPGSSCTWLIVAYAKGEDGTLSYSTFDRNRVLAVIDEEGLPGSYDEAAEPGTGDEICITARAQELRRFL